MVRSWCGDGVVRCGDGVGAERMQEDEDADMGGQMCGETMIWDGDGGSRRKL